MEVIAPDHQCQHTVQVAHMRFRVVLVVPFDTQLEVHRVCLGHLLNQTTVTIAVLTAGASDLTVLTSPPASSAVASD